MTSKNIKGKSTEINEIVLNIVGIIVFVKNCKNCMWFYFLLSMNIMNDSIMRITDLY